LKKKKKKKKSAKAKKKKAKLFFARSLFDFAVRQLLQISFPLIFFFCVCPLTRKPISKTSCIWFVCTADATEKKKESFPRRKVPLCRETQKQKERKKKQQKALFFL
jgi:hypothetical protein